MSFVCVDRIPGLAVQDALDRERGPLEAAGEPAYFWAPGTELRVRFLDGSPDLQRRVMAAAGDWTVDAGLTFTVVPHGAAEIRVTFAGPGNWSALGTLGRVTDLFPAGGPTMCLGEAVGAGPDRIARLARHEFGHAIGMIHEHSSPAAGIRWNKPVVYAALGGAPNYWSKSTVEDNVFGRYSESRTQFTTFDPTSIMLYALPPSWTLDGMTFPENVELSPMDKAFVRRVYPR
jgi:hypothetical protein